MSSKRLEILTCDRCGVTAQTPASHRAKMWGGLLAEQDGPFAIGVLYGGRPHREKADLCPECMNSLEDWWKSGAAPEKFAGGLAC
jgi:hypothetical protein